MGWRCAVGNVTNCRTGLAGAGVGASVGEFFVSGWDTIGSSLRRTTAESAVEERALHSRAFGELKEWSLRSLDRLKYCSLGDPRSIALL